MFSAAQQKVCSTMVFIGPISCTRIEPDVFDAFVVCILDCDSEACSLCVMCESNLSFAAWLSTTVMQPCCLATYTLPSLASCRSGCHVAGFVLDSALCWKTNITACITHTFPPFLFSCLTLHMYSVLSLLWSCPKWYILTQDMLGFLFNTFPSNENILHYFCIIL